MNICASHSWSYSGYKAWRDTGIRVEGKDVNNLTLAFNRAWDRALFSPHLETRKGRCNGLVRLNDSWSVRRKGYENLLRRIRHAKNRIWITSAYFVPHWRLAMALSRAARDGIDVKVLGPRTCDIPFIPLVRAVFYKSLIESGVKFYEYLPAMLHAKSLIVDDWAILGSSNLNHRSLIHDLEADIVLTKEESKNELQENFKTDLRHSNRVYLSDLKKRSWLENRSGEILLLLRKWM
jgi:cardiolipin synthase